MAGLDDHSSHPAGSGIVRAVQDFLRRLFAGPTRHPATAAPPPAPSRQARVMARSSSSATPFPRPAAAPRPGPRVVVPQTAGAAKIAQGAFQPAESVADPEADHRAPVFRPRLAPTTHTYEMSQLTVLDEKLRRAGGTATVTAADLGLAHKVPAQAALVSVRWDGPPECPYVHGRFSTGADSEPAVVDLDSAALREISHRLGLRQVWNE